jgi:hypothetical protein
MLRYFCELPLELPNDGEERLEQHLKQIVLNIKYSARRGATFRPLA